MRLPARLYTPVLSSHMLEGVLEIPINFWIFFYGHHYANTIRGSQYTYVELILEFLFFIIPNSVI